MITGLDALHFMAHVYQPCNGNKYPIPNGFRVTWDNHRDHWESRQVRIYRNASFDVLAFAGTDPGDSKDVAIDLDYELAPVPDDNLVGKRARAEKALAHSGALKNWTFIKTIFETRLDHHRPIVIVGHSLGWLLALTAVLVGLAHGYKIVLAIGAGCPRFGNRAMSELLAAMCPMFTISHSIASRWPWMPALIDPVEYIPLRRQGFEAECHLAVSTEHGKPPVIRLFDPDTFASRHVWRMVARFWAWRKRFRAHGMAARLEAWKTALDEAPEHLRETANTLLSKRIAESENPFKQEIRSIFQPVHQKE